MKRYLEIFSQLPSIYATDGKDKDNLDCVVIFSRVINYTFIALEFDVVTHDCFGFACLNDE